MKNDSLRFGLGGSSGGDYGGAGTPSRSGGGGGAPYSSGGGGAPGSTFSSSVEIFKDSHEEISIEQMAFEFAKIMIRQYLKEGGKFSSKGIAAEAVTLAIDLKKEIAAENYNREQKP